MRGLYVHIPFCLKKCHYCNFTITTRRSEKDKTLFFKALEEEIRHVERQNGPLCFDTVYLGGGTPSALSGSEMKHLVSLFKNYFSWPEDAEFTCEVNPGDVDPAKLEAFRELGINRISVGAQSFNDELLKQMGRVHNSHMIEKTFQDLNALGFKNISLDLIIRVPGQTLEDVESSVQNAVKLGAHQVVLYDLNIHDNTLFGVWHKQGKLIPLQDEMHIQMMKRAEEILVREQGYVQYEISNFAKCGYESRHNLIYWNNQEYLGLGPGAFSYLKGKRSVLSNRVSDYLEKCLTQNWQNEEEDVLSDIEQEMETLLTGLRLKNGVDLRVFPKPKSHLDEEIPRLLENGLLAEEGNRVYLTPRGKYLAETVFSELSRV